MNITPSIKSNLFILNFSPIPSINFSIHSEPHFLLWSKCILVFTKYHMAHGHALLLNLGKIFWLEFPYRASVGMEPLKLKSKHFKNNICSDVHFSNSNTRPTHVPSSYTLIERTSARPS